MRRRKFMDRSTDTKDRRGLIRERGCHNALLRNSPLQGIQERDPGADPNPDTARAASRPCSVAARSASHHLSKRAAADTLGRDPNTPAGSGQRNLVCSTPPRRPAPGRRWGKVRGLRSLRFA